MDLTLLILAAGMGSRYGGLKQLDGLGPNGETIMDYSVFDAKRAGFNKVVFVVRRDFASEFDEKIVRKYKGKINVEYVFQDLKDIPSGYNVNVERTKPWGTGHAMLMGKKDIHEPFAVINADDFYGADAYKVMADYLQKVAGTKGKYSMVAYNIANTLSESGSVSRGVCSVNGEHFLTNVVERTKIERQNGVIKYQDDNGNMVAIPENTVVSMNFWGFTPDVFEKSETEFCKFLLQRGMELKSEFYIPTIASSLIEQKQAEVKVLETSAKWFGVTYHEDRPNVVKSIQNMIDKGEYPEKLW